MAGILDMFDDPNLMSRLFGIEEKQQPLLLPQGMPPPGGGMPFGIGGPQPPPPKRMPPDIFAAAMPPQMPPQGFGDHPPLPGNLAGASAPLAPPQRPPMMPPAPPAHMMEQADLATPLGGIGSDAARSPNQPPIPPQMPPQIPPELLEKLGGIGSDAARAPNQPGNAPQVMPGIGSDMARSPDQPMPPVPPMPPGAGPQPGPGPGGRPQIPPQALAALAQRAGMPMPMENDPDRIGAIPRPVMPPAGGPGGGPMPGGPPGRAAPAGAVPGGAPMPPPGYMANSPTGASTGGGLAGALGIDPNRMRNMMASIGKGMTAVGQAKPGAFPGTVAAAGLGGALTGSVEDTDKVRELDRKDKNDLFNQSSTAFKDMQLAKDGDDKSAYRAAQSRYLDARAKAIELGGTATGSKAWQNTPLGQVNVIEQRVAAFDTPRRKSIDAQVRNQALPPAEAQKLYDNLDKQTEQYRKNLLKDAKIDPKDAEKFKTMGLEPPMIEGKANPKFNPFDMPAMTKGMNPDQALELFHQQVPLGAWYLDQHGKPKQRTKPRPGAETTTAAPKNASVEMNTDDEEAMTPAAA